MKKFIATKSFILAVACVLGQAASLSAAETGSASGLIGQRYATFNFGYVDLNDTAFSVRTYRLACNQNVAQGLDARLELDYLRSDAVLGTLFRGGHYTDRNATAGLRAFKHSGRVTPYVEAGAGWTWFELSDWREDSFLWYAGAGAEFMVADNFTVTPYLRYQDRPTNFRRDVWNYGVRGNYQLTASWGLTLALDRNDEQDLESQAGLTYRF